MLAIECGVVPNVVVYTGACISCCCCTVCCNILVAVVLFLMLCYWHLYVVFLLYDTIPAAVCFFVTLGLYNFMCCTIMS